MTTQEQPVGSEATTGTEATTGSERAVLTAILDRQRAAVVAKLSGLDEEQARRRLVPSATTLAGVLRHLIGVERWWFLRVLGGVDAADLPPNNRGDAPSWEVGDDETVAGLVAEYRAVCEQSRRAAAAVPLDHVVPHHKRGAVSLRWILAHMVEETARHAGHVDVLREQIDGATGVDG